ncbi:MAG: hypothetical protein U0800_03145 [Isosphaeraceae bacterium]
MKSELSILAVVAAAALPSWGCGGASDGPERQPVAGRVSFDGKPLERGLITFQPVDDKLPVVSAVVEGGEFALPKSEGPAAGPHKVSVWARKATGKKVKDPDNTGLLVEEHRELIPEQYNLRTTLTAEVPPGGEKALAFELKPGRPARR